MTQIESCDQCGQKHQCQEAFRRLGNAQGRSVFLSSLTAFVLPLAVFIVVLAVAQWFLARYIDSDGLRAAVALLVAVAVAAACVIIVRMTCKFIRLRRMARPEKMPGQI